MPIASGIMRLPQGPQSGRAKGTGAELSAICAVAQIAEAENTPQAGRGTQRRSRRAGRVALHIVLTCCIPTISWLLISCRRKGKMSCNVRQRQRRSILEALRRARIDAGLTISELAKRADVSRDTISHAERGRHSLQAPTLSKIAHALGRAPSELLAEEERLSPKGQAPSSPEQPDFNGLLEGERRRAERDKRIEALPGWTSAAVEDEGFVQRFEAAKSSPTEARDLVARQREETGRVIAQLRDLKKRDAPPAELQEAKRDLAQARARETACTFMEVDLWRGQDVADVRPVDILAEVAAAQHDIVAALSGEGGDVASEVG
jgi:transcriptional regulator with XRE-family HTH domain